MTGLAALLCVACAGERSNIGEHTQEVAGKTGEIEWSIDAPWRMEPYSSGAYGPIPITISFHDGSEQKDEATTRELKKFCGMTVAEVSSDYLASKVHQMPIGFFHEIESHAKWPASSDVPAFHNLRRIWAGEGWSDVRDIGGSAMWAGTAMLRPDLYGSAGDDARLVAVAVVSSTETCPKLPNNINDVLNGGFEQKRDGVYYFRNYLRVRYGNALPRFSNAWVYGDVHYHSQGTDNEGEAGIPYRATIQTMKAMGLDFAFATEHASDSDQLTDVDDIFLTRLPDIIPDVIKDWLLEKASAYALPNESSRDQLRDMSAQRYSFLWHWLNDSDGVNAQVLSSPGNRTPQLFLGGEVDAVPEISAAERASGKIAYGNGKIYNWKNACAEVPDQLLTVMNYTSFDICGEGVDGLVEEASEGGRFLVRDVQGLGANYFARQHFVHLPVDTEPALNTTTFISGKTSHYGGATQRLKDILSQDYDIAAPKGVFFLAHPVAAASGSGPGRLGPDLIPYSDVQLKTAFFSKAFLGLQLWNEDERVHSEPGRGFPMASTDQWPMGWWGNAVWGWWQHKHDGQFSSLHHGAATWDRMNLWGLDPAKRPGWTEGGPRRVFMAGGSDAHGDFNFRRTGYVVGWTGANDSRIGSPRNLVDVGLDRPKTVGNTQTIGQNQVLEGLRSGRFVVTDGPIVRIAVDMNGNNVIDDGDVPMGAVADYSCDVPLLVEWKSSEEFGKVKRIDLYVGAYHAGYKSRVYAPVNHGVRGSSDPKGTINGAATVSGGGRTYRELHDGYAVDPTGMLRFRPNSYSGTRKIVLRPQQFELWEKSCTTEQQCEYDPDLHKPICVPLTTCELEKHAKPSSLFVRAFATSMGKELMRSGEYDDVRRMGYTNPVWLKPDGSTCSFCPAFDSSHIDWGFCSNKLCPCGAGEGDCDRNSDCEAGLECHQNVGSKYGLSSGLDLCEPPIVCEDFDPDHPDGSFCTADCPCGLGEGDCDNDNQCDPGLKCGVNNGPSFGLPTGWEVCVKTGPLCGNGEPNSGEECDDANRSNGDGCSSTCQVEYGWTCPRWDSCVKLPPPCFPHCGGGGFGGIDLGAGRGGL